ncbi:MAG: sigma-54-dependent Fis family transcriptional regulator [Betaproteobacteria bacterium]|nr:sigma-54-dependent Fis family transcriptional regulator [Betaproteobacteria bacterium]
MTICNSESKDTKPVRNESVLIIDDDHSIGQCVECILQIAGYKAVFTSTGKDGLERFRDDDFDLVITDLKLPDISGLDVVSTVRQQDPNVPVILMTSFSSMESAIEALRKGAVDYIIKPFRNDDFAFAVERALNERRIKRENAVLKRSLKKVFTSNKIIGESEGIKRVLALIQRVASTEANVLIQGESGTGKELVAQAIHYSSARAEGPFVPVNCGAIPGELLESELFGHTKGAFTGAVTAAEGLIREGSGGTLFLDEISELPLNLQVKLLRVLQERQVRPLGSTSSYVTDTRFLAASNRDLKAEMEKGNFRPDLFYRLNVISIQVPPLRERGRDIEILAQHFVQQHSRRMAKKIKALGRDLIDFLNKYHWPGNVRELENVIERAVILADSAVLTCGDLTEILPAPSKASVLPALANKPLSIEEYIMEFVKRYQDTHSETELAAMLGIGRKALWVRRNRWGLHRGSAASRGNHANPSETEAA